jgi:L-fucose mutarotase
MLKTIDPLLVPDLLAALAEMGHGDVLAVVDRNFPAHSCGRRVIELPGAEVTEVLRAVLTLLPVDAFQDPAAWHMRQDDGEDGPAVPGVRAVLDSAEQRAVGFAGVDRPSFYELARAAYCTVRTADDRPYACFLVAKGVVA